jgi:hypothetical protein
MNLPPRFLNWRLVDGRKMPCLPNGEVCDAHDPANHLTYDRAAATGLPVAFDIRKEDGLFFLDLDKCRLPDGSWRADAVAIFTSFAGAWGEVSQSGTGLHIIGRCDPSRLADRRNKWDGWLECYTDQRFVAFGSTGWAPIGGTATDRDFTDQLLRVVPQRENLGDLPEGVDPAYTGPADDDALIAMMLRSGGGAGAAFGMKASVGDLWRGDVTILSRLYPAFDGAGGFDRSSADAALMAHLAFWTGKDMPRMDRLFRRSALMREKYERREDYRRDTVGNAARLCRTVYDRPAPVAAAGVAAGAPAPEVFLTIPELHEHFKGCIYIQDMHRVLIPDGRILKPEQFNAIYGGHLFPMMPDNTQPTKKAFEALTENRATRFPQAQRPCFRPDLAPGLILNDGSVNIYVDPQVATSDDPVGPFLDLLNKLLPVERDRAILLAWMAACVQYPGVKFQWAPVLQGCEGNGKTGLLSCVAYAVGRRYSHMPKANKVGGQFNAFLEGKIFILIEEIHMQGRREVLDDLKPLITNRDIEIEGKGADQRMIENVANWAFCTNYKDAVLKSRNDRRYSVFFTAQQSAGDLTRDGMTGQYFPALYEWLRVSGYAAVAGFLRRYQIPADLNPAKGCHRAPETSSTEESITESMGGIEQEILEAAEDNTVGFRGGWVSSWALDKLMRDRGIRIGRNKVLSILEGMGYERFGRTANPVMQEDGKRPVLYKRPDAVSDYARAQNYPA